MTVTLLNLADAYEREAVSMWTSQRERWALREGAALFRRMACNREAADPGKLTVHLWMLIDVTQRWCQQHGYRAVAGVGGLVVQRGGEEAITVVVGDTLVWDGRQITVRPNR